MRALCGVSVHPITMPLIFTLLIGTWGSHLAAETEAGEADQGGRLVAMMKGHPADESSDEITTLTLLRARYQVDLFGAVAVGRTIYEFRNDSDIDLLETYPIEGGETLKARSVRFEIDGQAEEDLNAAGANDEAGEKPPEPASARNARSRKPRGGKDRSRALRVDAGRTVTAISNIQFDVPLEDGRFRLRLPAVMNGPEKPGAGRAGGSRAFARIEEEKRPAAGPVPMSIGLRIFHDQALLDVGSRSHQILTGYEGDHTVVELARMEVEDGRAFDLTFALGSESEATLIAYAGAADDDGTDVVIVLSPPTDPWSDTVRAKQMLFVLDTSGSMKGNKIEHARAALTAALDELGPDDQFNIVEFDHHFSLFRPEPVSVASVGSWEASGWLLDREAAGGTKILPGLSAAMQQSESPDHHRMIVMLTDGMNTDEEEVLKTLDENLGVGRLFVIGIGRDAHPEKIERMAEHGRGTAVFADDPKSIEAVVARLFNSVSAPLAWDLEIDWAGALVDSVQPERLPDLYAGRTVTAVARLIGTVPEILTVRGKTTEGEQEWTVTVRQLEDPLPESLTADRPTRGKEKTGSDTAAPGKKQPASPGPDKTRTRPSGSSRR